MDEGWSGWLIQIWIAASYEQKWDSMKQLANDGLHRPGIPYGYGVNDGVNAISLILFLIACFFTLRDNPNPGILT